MPAVDVVVVGAGVMGCATARAVARSGRHVLLLEQFEIGHRRGSSHGASRIFRYSYNEAAYVAMAMESLELWRELEVESGSPLLTTLGGLDLGPTLEAHVSALEAHGARFEMLSGRQAARRFPAFSFPPGDRVLFQPDAGIVAAERAVRAFLAGARASGARVEERARVGGLRVDGNRVELDLGGRAVEAEVAVVTAGAWARGLLAGAGIDLPTSPSRETVAYFDVGGADTLPPVVDWGSPSVYALPSPGQGLKAGEHHAGPHVDPDDEGEANQDSVRRLRSWVAERYRSPEIQPRFVETCLYTNTPDEGFVLERRGPVVVGSACSGHGFKFAPLIGRRLAELALAS
ncbi:MAG: N-methyl-L-tryptophan oxidase [Actinobacteria bacterium]|nr:N-methyl-L-tryptophan oxidase [Actinomycetota bacterium]